MTPAVNLAKKANIPFTVHEYQHHAGADSYGQEAARKLGLNPRQVLKTLIVKLDGQKLAVGIVPVAGQLDLKAMAKACGAKKAAMAEQAEAEKSSGYVLGGISPLGQKKRLMTVLDKSAEQFETIHVSAGRRGLEIELAPAALITLTNGQLAPIGK
ncbi:hypothetical protein GZ77_10445 [Endozoicomonas montiporae]|uniref:Cys-tRNA(Pro)/Cys-tRNA(Cys) deacylase n=2 Tax=Endozoicomonas montiporae TaxID=1027273 RepID=A0A081N8E4_9GAMM|nr:Cys-tRNA(Pro) deacylase [Endozoicomonas montiporae]AMO55393.1 cys-tRNA(Pro)/Cys-tRNA(Cys) deacylase [Endozoicomonas montiporae CL-33]KEQ14717.1 hypothetical protein GZ77_10445 [Endozoicomonas montiporae]